MDTGNGVATRDARRHLLRQTTKLFSLAAGLVLLLLLIALRNVTMLPIAGASSLTPLARLGDLALVAFLVILAHAAGARVMRVCGLRAAPVEGVPVAAGLGLGIGAYSALALGLVGLYRPPVLLVGLLAVTVLLWRDLAVTGAEVATWPGKVRRAAAGAPRGVPLLVTLLSGASLLAIVGALTPPHHWDPLTYHLVAPQRFLLTGWIAPLPGIEYANFPLTVELLFGIGLALGSDVLPALFHLAFGGIIAAATWGIASRHFDRATAWLAVAIFLSTPLVPVWARVANIDLALGAFLLLALAAVLRVARPAPNGTKSSADSSSWRWLALAGVFAGIALGSKYQALYGVAPLGLTVLITGWLRQGKIVGDRARAAIGDAVIFGGACAIVAAPWYLKNWIVLGNPVWPFVFGGHGLDPMTAELAQYFLRGLVLSPRTLTGYLLLPVRAYTVGDFEQRLAIASPLFLLLPLLALLRRAWRRELAFLLIVAGGFIAAWTLGVQELRYLLMVCGPLSIATACVLRAGWDHRWLRHLVLPSLIVSALLSLGITGLHVGADNPIGILTGRTSQEAYLRESITYGASHRALRFVEPRLGPGEGLLFLEEAQVYYLSPTTRVQTDHFHTNLVWLSERYPEPADAIAWLRSERIGYLVVNEANIRFWSNGDPEGRLLRARERFGLLAAQLELVYRDGPVDRPAIVIYRVPPGVAAP